MGSLLLAGILLYGAYAQFQQTRVMLWNLLVWFRVATAGFFGFGNLVPYFGNAATVAQIRNLYDFSHDQALTVLLLTAMSCFFALSVAHFFFIRVSDNWSFSLRGVSRSGHLMTALLFLALGGVARYGVVLPLHYGWIDLQVPGWMHAMSAAYAAGLFMLILWSLRYSKPVFLVSLALAGLDVMMAALAFDKSEVVLTLLFSFMAILYHRFSLLKAVTGAALVVGVIYFAQSPAHYGRAVLNLSGKDSASLGERMAIVGQYIRQGDTITRWSGGDLNPFIRVSYLNVAAFVVGEYDAGRPGQAHAHAFAAIVPRLFWPNKPHIGAAASEIFYLLRGRQGAAVGVGHSAAASHDHLTLLPLWQR